MNISEFIQLDINSRTAIALQGAFIANKTDNGTSLRLYSICSFFAEICYNIIDGEVITVNASNNPEMLARYSEKVDISSLLQ